jgi:GTP pyrophosphokinase
MHYHDGKVRKCTDIPYVSHVMAVAAIALEHGGTETEAIAALLHDAVEDAGGPRTRERVARDFGEEVAAIVDGCTDDAPDEGQDKRPWAERKREYIAHVADASASVLLVSAADKLHNARAILDDFRHEGDSVWSRFNASGGEILWYYTSLISAFRDRIAILAGSSECPDKPQSDLDSLIDNLARIVMELRMESGLEPQAPAG